MLNDEHKLDNPAWHSLCETHSEFSTGNDTTKRYHRDIVAFAAFDQKNVGTFDPEDSVILIDESFFIIGDLPQLSQHYLIENVLPCAQMICEKRIEALFSATISKLDEDDDEEMVGLINMVQPGYYQRGTRLMGDYFGIRENDKLVAITGERMRMEGFTEVSAVVTHPDFTGKGYARQLVAHVVNKNLAAVSVPFLHVSETNHQAINLYEYLGFKKRRSINFTKIKRIK